MPDPLAATALVCPACGASYDVTGRAWWCSCGHALDFDRRAGPEGGPPHPGSLDQETDLRAFESWLPVDRQVSLGEGCTPLLEVPALGVECKLDYRFPTGSHKNRCATAIISHGLAFLCPNPRASHDPHRHCGATTVWDVDSRSFLFERVYHRPCPTTSICSNVTTTPSISATRRISRGDSPNTTPATERSTLAGGHLSRSATSNSGPTGAGR